MQNGEKLPKRKIPAEIELSDGSRIKVALFVSPQGRLLDLLNDDRGFLPLETDGGETVFIRKDAILRVAPIPAPKEDRDTARAARDAMQSGSAISDPYELLGIGREATAAEIREAYRQRCLENHPDRLQALGLAKEYVEFANRRMAEINVAYDRLREARRDS